MTAALVLSGLMRYLTVLLLVLVLALCVSWVAWGKYLNGMPIGPGRGEVAEAERELVVTRIYDVRELVVQLPDFTEAPDFSMGPDVPAEVDVKHGPTRAEIVDELVKEVADRIAKNGGDRGKVREVQGHVIITQTVEHHSHIAQHLERKGWWRNAQTFYKNAALLVGVSLAITYVSLLLGNSARRVIAPRRIDRGLCGRCGHDLRESPHRCPECGLARV